MPTRLDFGISHTYNDRDNGISIPVKLIAGTRDVDLTAIVDTGSTFCLFERAIGEWLGLDIEAGDRQEFRTAAGRFVAFGHELTLSTLGLEMDATESGEGDADIEPGEEDADADAGGDPGVWRSEEECGKRG